VKNRREIPLSKDSIFNEIVMRQMGMEHLEEIIEIEQESFPTPWTLGIFMREFELEFSHRLVFEYLGEIVGYIVFWLIEGEVHIMSVAVRSDMRRGGLGSEILGRVLDHARTIGGKYVFLEVRENNTAAIHLYKKHGFSVEFKRKGYYTDTKEDALIMIREL
jgi:[ribosomal protein S18]-alanine N-acetyltransferase